MSDKLRCPKCKSPRINQYRMLTGPIWCEHCGYRVEQKEIDHSFYPDWKPPREKLYTQSEYDALAARVRRDILKIDCTWPVQDILKELITGASILLNKIDYDSDGWERIVAAKFEGEKWLTEQSAIADGTDAQERSGEEGKEG